MTVPVRSGVEETILERRYTLKQAVAKFYPDGPITVSSLRTEIRKGRLEIERIAGRICVTQADIAKMLERCREEGPAVEARAANDTRAADLRIALAAARATCERLKASGRK